jgi:hypothetical protein
MDKKIPTEIQSNFKVVYEAPAGEKIIDMILFKGHVIVATERQILKINGNLEVTPMALAEPEKAPVRKKNDTES